MVGKVHELAAVSRARFFWSRVEAVAGLVLLISLAQGISAEEKAPAVPLFDFAISDQFGRTHRHTDYVGKVLVVIGSDKDGSKFNGAWNSAIDDALKSHANYARVAYLPVADTRGVPFFIKPFVRRKFSKDKKEWVVLDWKGRFAKTYSYEPGSCNILVFDTTRRLVHRAHGTELNPVKVKEIALTVRRILSKPTHPPSN